MVEGVCAMFKDCYRLKGWYRSYYPYHRHHPFLKIPYLGTVSSCSTRFNRKVKKTILAFSFNKKGNPLWSLSRCHVSLHTRSLYTGTPFTIYTVCVWTHYLASVWLCVWVLALYTSPVTWHPLFPWASVALPWMGGWSSRHCEGDCRSRKS